MATPTSTHPAQQVDVRGPRFAAWVTTGVLVLVRLPRIAIGHCGSSPRSARSIAAR